MTAVREPKIIASSSRGSKSTASGSDTDAIAIDSGDESDGPVTKKKALKRKVMIDQEADESDEDTGPEKFSLKLTQIKKDVAVGRHTSDTDSEASSNSARRSYRASFEETQNVYRFVQCSLQITFLSFLLSRVRHSCLIQ